MELHGQTVVVGGATGVVGSGAVRAFLDAAATVVGVSRSAQRLEELQAGLPAGADFRGVVGDPVDDDAVLRLRADVEAALGGAPVDHAVSALGFVTMADPPSVTPLGVARQAMQDGLYPNIGFAQALLPLQAGGTGPSFTLVSGGFAHGVPPEAPQLWLGTVKNAAVSALTSGLAAEQGPHGVQVTTACVHVGVAPAGGSSTQLGFPAAHDTLALGPVFPALATHPRHGQVVCLTDWDTVDQLAAG
jgi:NAD(P)-dependent dehydrogenase (short-subunit alcohol dehydrogenase family)